MMKMRKVERKVNVDTASRYFACFWCGKTNRKGDIKHLFLSGPSTAWPKGALWCGDACKHTSDKQGVTEGTYEDGLRFDGRRRELWFAEHKPQAGRVEGKMPLYSNGLVSLATAAAFTADLGRPLSADSLRKYAHDGLLQTEKLGRDHLTTEDWIREFLAGRKTGPAGGRPSGKED